MYDIGPRLKKLQDEIHQTALQCGRDPHSITLLAVSKTFPVQAIEQAAAAGQGLFGENRVQEAEEKIPCLAERQLEWHLIGHLQSNKARRAVELFDVIQTLDSEKITRKVAGYAAELDRRLRVFVQVNIGLEKQKYGVDPSEAAAMVRLVDSLPSLRLQGLMTIPPFDQDPEKSRPCFRSLRQLQERINRERVEPLPHLSMGMSHDFRVAVQEGATLLRIGTAIFGPRQKG